MDKQHNLIDSIKLTMKSDTELRNQIKEEIKNEIRRELMNQTFSRSLNFNNSTDSSNDSFNNDLDYVEDKSQIDNIKHHLDDFLILVQKPNNNIERKVFFKKIQKLIANLKFDYID